MRSITDLASFRSISVSLVSTVLSDQQRLLLALTRVSTARSAGRRGGLGVQGRYSEETESANSAADLLRSK
jgi:hypothetical protein